MTSRISGSKHYLQNPLETLPNKKRQTSTKNGIKIQASNAVASTASIATQTAAAAISATASASAKASEALILHLSLDSNEGLAASASDPLLKSLNKFAPPPPRTLSNASQDPSHAHGAAVAAEPPAQKPMDFGYTKEAAANLDPVLVLETQSQAVDSQATIPIVCEPPKVLSFDSFVMTRKIATGHITNKETPATRVLYITNLFRSILSFLGSSIFSESLFTPSSPQKLEQIPAVTATAALKPLPKTDIEILREREAKIEVLFYKEWHQRTLAIPVRTHLVLAKNWLHHPGVKDCVLLGRITRQSLCTFYNLHGQELAKYNHSCRWQAFFSYSITEQHNHSITHTDIETTSQRNQSFSSATCLEAVHALDLSFLKEIFAKAHRGQLAHLLHYKWDDISTIRNPPLFLSALQLDIQGKEKEIDEIREFLYQTVKTFGFSSQLLFPHIDQQFDTIFKYLTLPSRYVQSGGNPTLLKDNLPGLEWLVNRVRMDEAAAKTAAQSATASASALNQINPLIKQLNDVLENPLLLPPGSSLKCIKYLLDIQKKKVNFNQECMIFVQRSNDFSTEEFRNRMALIKDRVSFNHCENRNDYTTIPIFYLLLKSTKAELKAYYDASHTATQHSFTTQIINAFYAMDLNLDNIVSTVDHDIRMKAIANLVLSVSVLPKEKKPSLHEAIIAMRFLTIYNGEDLSERVQFLEALVKQGGIDPNLRCRRKQHYLTWHPNVDGMTIKEMCIKWNPSQEQPIHHAPILAEQLKAFVNEYCTVPNKKPADKSTKKYE